MAQINTRIVLRNDSSANWLANESVVLLKGEVGIEFMSDNTARMKIGDGVKTFAELPYFGGNEAHVYEAEVAKGGDHVAAITAVVGDVIPNTHDVAIVKEAIIAEEYLTENIEQKYQHTAYRYDGTGWIALDGNYSAENVYFTEDFTFTEKIGTVQTLTNGSATVAAAGKSVKDFFAGLFAAEQDPSKTDPSVTVTLTGAGAYEVGTVLTPSYTATFEDGKYTYGPEPTGATVESWAVTSTTGESFDSASGTCAELTVGDSTSYSVTAKATHTAGVYGKTNLGNDSNIQIAAGTKSKTSSAITGYRKSFYGSNVDAVELTSANIRGLAGSSKSTATTLTVDIVEGAKQVIIAVPSGKTVKKVADDGAFGTDIFSEFALNAVDVMGLNDYTAKAYNVYVYSPAAALGKNTYTVTVG